MSLSSTNPMSATHCRPSRGGRHLPRSPARAAATAARPHRLGHASTASSASLYDEARQDYHCQLLLIATPDIRRIIHHGSKLVIHNRGKQLGRRGLLVSGASGTGKSTSITQLGKKFQIDLQRRWPANPDRIPVVYIVVPPDAGPKALATELAAFLGLPIHPHDGAQHVAHAAAEVLRRVSTGMVLVDEIHRLDLTTKKGKDACDQLKYFFDTVPATFIYCGLDLEESHLFSGYAGARSWAVSSPSTPGRSATAPTGTNRTGSSSSPRWSRPFACTSTNPER